MAFDLESALSLAATKPPGSGFDLDSAKSLAAAAQAQPTTGEAIAGNPLTRFAMGAASPLVGTWQLGANLGDWINSKIDPYLPESLRADPERAVGKFTNKLLADLEGTKQRGMEKMGHGTTDVSGLLGNLATGLLGTSALAGKLPAATTPLGRMVVGGAQGALAGAMAPVVTGDEGYGGQKTAQIGFGAGTGAALSGAVDLGKTIYGNIIDPVANLLRGEKGVKNIARQGYQTAIGKANIPAVADALKRAEQFVPGSKPTAAQAVAHLPEGSPVQALERLTARTQGGPSTEFGARLMKQEAAREIAKVTRNRLTQDAREQALALANQGKVEARDILDGISPIQQQPGLRSSDVVSKSLGWVNEKIARFTKPDGSIDAEDLYTIRKEIGNTIKTFSKDTQNWDKQLTGRIEGDIQKGIDWAINNGIRRAQSGPALAQQSGQRLLPGPSSAQGPTLWDTYLADYAQRSRKISQDLERAVAAKRPVQPTNLEKMTNLSQERMPHVALLSRPVVIANAVLKHLAGNIEPKVDALNTQFMLNPRALGEFLQPSTAQPPSRFQPMIDALLAQQAQIPGAAGIMATRQ